MFKVQESYRERIDRFSVEENKYRKYSLYCLWLKLTTFLGCCVSLYAIHPNYASYRIIIPVIFLFGYVVFFVFDAECCSRSKSLRKKIKVCSDELAGMEGDYTAFANGKEFVNPQHPYSIDLDIFGPDSLFHRLNRTVTRHGSTVLAEKLMKLPYSKDVVIQNQEAIKELAALTDWRISFLTVDYMTGNLDGLSQHLVKHKYNTLSFATYLSYFSIGLTLLSLILGVFGFISFSFFGLMLTLQLIFASFVSKTQKKANNHINVLHKEYAGYLNIMRKIHVIEFKSEKLKAISNDLFGKKDSSMAAFKKLSTLLNLFDIRGSEIMYLLLNGLFLFDIFLIKEFTKWKEDHLPHIDKWLRAIGELDALVSLSTYAYNHPQNHYAHILANDTSDNIITAHNVCHPFLNSEQAIPNDFTLKKGNIAIVTGANMAGKSTFLRTIGITYLLASTGVPVCAEEFSCSLVSLFSSMRTTDNLCNNVSYFQAEILRLKQLTEYLTQHSHTLVILDEILKGTNSKDKLNGSILFLDSVSSLNMSGIIATHDLELAQHYEMQKDKFRNYCFEIELSDNIAYSYKITEGIAQNMNASYLLRNIFSPLHQNRKL